MPVPFKIAFVTIGQSPRVDIVPEMMADISLGLAAGSVEVEEFGVLDGMSPDDLDAMRAKEGEHSFATRMANGAEIVTSTLRTEARLNLLLERVDQQGFDLIVLLCTGTKIDPLQNTLVVDADSMAVISSSCIAWGTRRRCSMPFARQSMPPCFYRAAWSQVSCAR